MDRRHSRRSWATRRAASDSRRAASRRCARSPRRERGRSPRSTPDAWTGCPGTRANAWRRQRTSAVATPGRGRSSRSPGRTGRRGRRPRRDAAPGSSGVDSPPTRAPRTAAAPSTITTSSRNAATRWWTGSASGSTGSRAKRFVDHGWALDRAIAERAGIGFAGKHASVITLEAGSYVLLASIAVSVPLPVDAPSRRGCGSCTACMPSCPTGAIVAPGVIDARRCISYLTIEHRGPIPARAAPADGNVGIRVRPLPGGVPDQSPPRPGTARRRERDHGARSGAVSRPGGVPRAHATPSSPRAFGAPRSRARDAPVWRATARSRSAMPGIERRCRHCAAARSTIRTRSFARPLAGGSRN